MQDEQVPEYLEDLPAIPDDVLWDQIAERFDDLCEILQQTKLETKEQAIPRRHGISSKDLGVYWFDEEVGARVRSWLKIPYDPTRDDVEFSKIWRTAMLISERLKQKIPERTLDVSFVSDWGAFCQYGSIIEFEYLRSRPSLQYLEGAEKNSSHERQLWYSHLFVKLKEKGDYRRDTEMRTLEFIQDFLERDEFNHPNFPKEWFRAFLNAEKDDLVASLKDKKLSLKKIKNFVDQDFGDLPPLN